MVELIETVTYIHWTVIRKCFYTAMENEIKRQNFMYMFEPSAYLISTLENNNCGRLNMIFSFQCIGTYHTSLHLKLHFSQFVFIHQRAICINVKFAENREWHKTNTHTHTYRIQLIHFIHQRKREQIL